MFGHSPDRFRRVSFLFNVFMNVSYTLENSYVIISILVSFLELLEIKVVFQMILIKSLAGISLLRYKYYFYF